MYLSPDPNIRCDGNCRRRSIFHAFNPNVVPFPTDANHRRRELMNAISMVGLKQPEVRMRRRVIAAHVVVHHAMRVDEMAQRADTRFHSLHPAAWRPI